MESTKAKFQLGKIKNKYIIVDILSYTVETKYEIYLILHYSSR